MHCLRLGQTDSITVQVRAQLEQFKQQRENIRLGREMQERIVEDALKKKSDSSEKVRLAIAQASVQRREEEERERQLKAAQVR